jgi:predicted small lipoprotein YifL
MAPEVGGQELMEMKKTLGLACLLAAALAGCGQKGPLYLPGEARDIVTRPAPQTVDSPVTSPSPAPDVSKPEGSPTDESEDERKDETPEEPAR